MTYRNNEQVKHIWKDLLFGNKLSVQVHDSILKKCFFMSNWPHYIYWNKFKQQNKNSQHSLKLLSLIMIIIIRCSLPTYKIMIRLGSTCVCVCNTTVMCFKKISLMHLGYSKFPYMYPEKFKKQCEHYIDILHWITFIFLMRRFSSYFHMTDEFCDQTKKV